MNEIEYIIRTDSKKHILRENGTQIGPNIFIGKVETPFQLKTRHDINHGAISKLDPCRLHLKKSYRERIPPNCRPCFPAAIHLSIKIKQYLQTPCTHLTRYIDLAFCSWPFQQYCLFGPLWHIPTVFSHTSYRISIYPHILGISIHSHLISHPLKYCFQAEVFPRQCRITVFFFSSSF